MTRIIDGGLSTELERIGATFDGPLWTGRTLLDDPALIEQAHRNYVHAGADVIITSSYQLSRRGFAEIGLTQQAADDALRQAVAVARSAAGNSGSRVAASIGPFGAILHDGSEYRGNYGVSEDELVAFHTDRIAVLADARPDILLAETIPDLTEAQALARALVDTDLPVWVSFTSGDGAHLWSGAEIEAAIDAVSGIPALETIGFNCVHPGLVADLVTRAHRVIDRDIAVYPNKGGSWDAESGEWSDQTPRGLDEWWNDWADLNIAYVGGCCGNDATDIARLSQRV